MRKYASLQVLETWQVPGNAGSRVLRKAAHRVGFEYEPRPGFLYVRSRMISSRCNDNHDEFPADEIERGWKSFIGKPVFVNHHNSNHRRARGVIVAAALHRDRNRDGSPDTWVEGLMEVDAVRFPKLAQAILARRVNRTSMGVDVEESLCSACGNKATSPAEYCRHLPSLKGKKIRKRAKDGKLREEIIREICHGLSFFENSLLVEDPADPTAYVLGDVDARGMKMTAAGYQPTYGGTHCLVCHDPVKFNPAKTHLASQGWFHADSMRRDHPATPADAGKVHAGMAAEDARRDQEYTRMGEELGFKPRMPAGMPPDPFAHTGSRKGRSMLTTAPPLDYVPLMAEAASRPAYPNPADHPWYAANPVSSRHIVDKYMAASDDERALGHRWYADAHHIAHAISGGDTHKGGGVLSAYSPQTGWGVNMQNASRAFHSHAHGEEPPGKGSGAMDMQKKAASRILNGESYHSVLRAPKTNAFASLIHHGDDSPEDKAQGHSRVVVDRHAMSVAIGRRTTQDDDMSFLSNPHYYEHTADAYRHATHEINQKTGQNLAPHQVQAVTWGVQKRENDVENEKSATGKGRISRERNDQTRWKQHVQEHHPDIDPGNMHIGIRQAYLSAIRVLAYGETKIPSQVDTLRMEACPVCGEQDVWSGQRCPVCGFVVPPSMFRDPDVDKAGEVRDELDQDGQVDLPSEAQEATGPQAGQPDGGGQGSFPDADNQLGHPDQVAPDGVPAAQGNEEPIDPGAEEQAGEKQQEAGEAEEADAASKLLNCPACGTQMQPGDPGAAEGAPCPACGNAPLEPVAQEPLPQKGQRPSGPGGTVMGSAKEAAATAVAARQAALERENASLRAQLTFLANLAGVGPELEQIRRQADVMNPAQPVPDPPEEAPTQTTEDALASGGARPAGQNGAAPNPPGHTVDDPSRPGTTPGSVSNVPATQTTTAITPGVEIPTAPATNLVDVTAPVQGTNPSEDGGVPIQQRRIETDVRIDPDPLKASGPGIGGVGNDGTAYPWVIGEQPGQQKAASLQDQTAARTFASIRLARLRVTAGLDSGDELAVAAGIEKDASLSLPVIEREIQTLGKVASVAAPRRPQQRTASRAPSLAAAPLTAYASAASTADGDAEDIFLS